MKNQDPVTTQIPVSTQDPIERTLWGHRTIWGPRFQDPVGRVQDPVPQEDLGSYRKDPEPYKDPEIWEYATIHRGDRPQNLRAYENPGEPLEQEGSSGNQGSKVLPGASIPFGEPVSNIL